jgi:hypothetical protein
MITLLNGEEWNEQDILTKMVDDSFYYGHLGQNALSSSALKKLLDGPKAYRTSLRMSEDSQALRDGRLIHLSILEPHRLKDLVVVDGSKRTKAYTESIEEHGAHMVYTQAEVDNAYWIADAVRSNNEASFLLEGLDYEVAGVKMIDDLPFRGKADAISKDRSVIVDLKTTSSSINDFRWSAKNFNYSLQAALYLEIFGATEFYFLVVHKQSKEIGIFDCSEEFINLGRQEINGALWVYKNYFLADNSKELIDNYVIRGIL